MITLVLRIYSFILLSLMAAMLIIIASRHNESKDKNKDKDREDTIYALIMIIPVILYILIS